MTIENAMNTLSTLVGSNYETNFIRYDRQYKVMVQASPEYRALPEDILKLYVQERQGRDGPLLGVHAYGESLRPLGDHPA